MIRRLAIGVVALAGLAGVVAVGAHVSQTGAASPSIPTAQSASPTYPSMGSQPSYSTHPPQMPSKPMGASASSPRPTPAPTAVTGALKAVHSPGVVTDDMHLKPGQCHNRAAVDGLPLPDPACTPGAVDPAVTQSNIKTTICTVGWTAKVRPPASDTGHWKTLTKQAYSDPAGFMGEYDHLVPLELGGANSTSNLWPQKGAIPNPKDKIENGLKADVCSGQITLRQAQEMIAQDWTMVG